MRNLTLSMMDSRQVQTKKGNWIWVPGTAIREADFDNWEQVCEIFVEMSHWHQPAKQQSPLISPAVYGPTKYRRNENVLGWDTYFIDVDNTDWTLQQIWDWLAGSGLAWCVYTSPSHSQEKTKCRLIFPLCRRLYPAEIPTFWQAAHSFFNAWGDPQCKDISRAYYVPGRYEDAQGECLIRWETGEYLNPDVLQAEYPAAADPELPTPSEPHSPPRRRLKSRSIHYTNIKLGPVIKDWLAIPHGQGLHYGGLYRAMVRIACRARLQGIKIDETDLAHMAEELVNLKRPYRNEDLDRNLTREARNALEWAERTA